MAACHPASPTCVPSMPSGSQGRRFVVGVDEVGTGALCAPVVAAAVLVRPHTRKIAGVRDSKTLSLRQRERLVDEIKARSLAWGVGAASVARDRATQHPQRRAPGHAARPAPPAALRPRPRGRPEDRAASRSTSGPTRPSSTATPPRYAIACASIIAKVTRDRLMARLALRYPGYGWEHNAGYATRDHVAGLRALGVTPFHRRTYQRIRGILDGDQLAFGLGRERDGATSRSRVALVAVPQRRGSPRPGSTRRRPSPRRTARPSRRRQGGSTPGHSSRATPRQGQ